MAIGRVFQGAVHMTQQLDFDCGVPAYVVVIAVLMIAFLVVGVG
jgi:hypothetical protein